MRGLRGLRGLGGMIDSIKNHHSVCWYLMDSADTITASSVLKSIKIHQIGSVKTLGCDGKPTYGADHTGDKVMPDIPVQLWSCQRGTPVVFCQAEAC